MLEGWTERTVTAVSDWLHALRRQDLLLRVQQDVTADASILESFDQSWSDAVKTAIKSEGRLSPQELRTFCAARLAVEVLRAALEPTCRELAKLRAAIEAGNCERFEMFVSQSSQSK